MLGRLVPGLVIGTSLVAAPAAAIVSNPPPRVCNEFPRSDYVFSGKVLSDTYGRHARFRGGAAELYRIRVDRTFKGKVPPIVRLYTATDSGRGVLTVGQRAILFAGRTEGGIAFDGSSNSQSGSGVPKIIGEIQDYLNRPPTVATIAGRVDSWITGAMAPLGGVRLLLANGKTKRFVHADAQGAFLPSLSPGNWSVRIAEPGWASRTGVYSYDSAESTHLRTGGCADLQIETAAPGQKLDGPNWKRWPR